MSFRFDPLASEARFENFLRPVLEQADPAHDLAHVRRVVENARRLAAAEGARLAVVLPAAWLHDCVIVPKDSPHRSHASREAAAAAVAFLVEIDYPLRDLEPVRHAIEAHSFSAGIAPTTLEAKVVQDADRLDAIGAVGIARCLMLAGRMNSALYHPNDPFPYDRAPDDKRYAVDHFYAKLLGLADTMQTPTGRQEAKRRTCFLETFLDQLGSEISAADGRVASSIE